MVCVPPTFTSSSSLHTCTMMCRYSCRVVGCQATSCYLSWLLMWLIESWLTDLWEFMTAYCNCRLQACCRLVAGRLLAGCWLVVVREQTVLILWLIKVPVMIELVNHKRTAVQFLVPAQSILPHTGNTIVSRKYAPPRA